MLANGAHLSELSKLCPSYVLDMFQIRVRSTMVPGSFMLRLNSLINETTYCINSM
jgi:hypothetical protein